jgi:carboxylesterase type B
MAGDSAGGASVTLHLTAYGGRDDHLFSATAAESQSFAAIRDVSESQYQYDNLVVRTGCVGAPKGTLACLRGLNTTYFQNQSFNIPFPGQSILGFFSA